MNPSRVAAFKNRLSGAGRILARLARSLALAWLALLVLVAVFQRSLTYFPSRATESELLAEGSRDGFEPWRDPAGRIIGWRRARTAARAANRMLVFHGNAGYALHRWPYIEGFGTLAPGTTWDVHLLEYPGYGARAGKPGEESFNEAAEAAFAAMRAEDQRPIFVLGESIGSGPACALAAGHPGEVAGICLITPFARLADVAAHHYPFLPVRLLLQDRWDNLAALAAYRGRLGMRIAGRDEIVTAAQGRLLFEAFEGPKRLWVDPPASHNTLDITLSNPWWREVSDFLLDTP